MPFKLKIPLAPGSGGPGDSAETAGKTPGHYQASQCAHHHCQKQKVEGRRLQSGEIRCQLSRQRLQRRISLATPGSVKAVTRNPTPRLRYADTSSLMDRAKGQKD